VENFFDSLRGYADIPMMQASQHCLGAEDGPQEKQGISGQLASAARHMTEVCQKVLCGIHPARIIESATSSKFR
jgi:hypothetical protein